MKLSYLTAVWAVGAILFGAAQRSNADVTVTMHGSFGSPALNQQESEMGAEQRAAMDKMLSTTYFYSGKKMRIETAFMTMIVDTAAKQTIIINDAAHTYMVSPMDPDILKSSGPAGQLGAGASFKAVDTGKTANVLGYTCHIYALTMSMGSSQSNMTMHGTVYATESLTGIDPGVIAALAARFGTGVKGVALREDMEMTTAMGDMSVKQTATKVSTASIPSSDFAPPAGYTKTSMGQGMDGSGGMGGLGGGMGGL